MFQWDILLELQEDGSIRVTNTLRTIGRHRCRRHHFPSYISSSHFMLYPPSSDTATYKVSILFPGRIVTEYCISRHLSLDFSRINDHHWGYVQGLQDENRYWKFMEIMVIDVREMSFWKFLKGSMLLSIFHHWDETVWKSWVPFVLMEFQFACFSISQSGIKLLLKLTSRQ